MTIGWVALTLAAALSILVPPGWPAVVLGGVATVGLGGDRRLGWLAGAMLVAIALPYGRSADTSPFTIGTYPIRPGDLAILLGTVGAAATAVRDRSSIMARLVRPGAAAFTLAGALLLLVGVGAFLLGVAEGHAWRDILRDARWWGLYLVAPLAVLSGTTRASAVRALLVGSTVFALITFATALGPPVEGGLKAASLLYDRGSLRMQFGNSIFLVPAIAVLVHAALRRPELWRLGWLALLVGAQTLSLTRMSVFVTGAVVLGVVAAHAWQPHLVRSLHRARQAWSRSAAAMLLAVSLGVVGGISAAYIGLATSSALPPGITREPEDPLGRFSFDGSRSSLAAILGSAGSGGRFATYLNAAHLIVESPLTGHGFGQLIEVKFAYADRAYTVGKQPVVDDAYLSVGVKAGIIGMTAFLGVQLVPLIAAVRRHRWRHGSWYLPAWLGILALMVSQSFAVSGFGPFGLALLAAIPFLGATERGTR